MWLPVVSRNLRSSIFLEAILLRSLLNKIPLYNRTEHRFILIQFMLYMFATCFGLYLGHYRGLMMARVQAETCHTRVKAQFESK